MNKRRFFGWLNSDRAADFFTKTLSEICFFLAIAIFFSKLVVSVANQNCRDNSSTDFFTYTESSDFASI